MFGFPWDDTNCMVSWDGTDFFVNDGVFTVSNGFQWIRFTKIWKLETMGFTALHSIKGLVARRRDQELLDYHPNPTQHKVLADSSMTDICRPCRHFQSRLGIDAIEHPCLADFIRCYNLNVCKRLSGCLYESTWLIPVKLPIFQQYIHSQLKLRLHATTFPVQEIR